MPILYAHRGAATELPENTLPAFVRALELGADAIETDAHLTRDGHVVLSHDESGGRMAGVMRAIADCTLQEVQSWDVGARFVDARGRARRGFRMPTFAEVLRELPSTVVLNVDAKPRSDAMVDALVGLIRRFGAQGRVRIASFHAANLRRVRALGYEGQTGLAQTEVARLVFQPSPLLRRYPLMGQAAQIPLKVGPIRLDTPAFLAKAHGLGLRVDYWTINDPREAERLLRLGADGIMTDDPAAVAPAMRAFRARA